MNVNRPGNGLPPHAVPAETAATEPAEAAAAPAAAPQASELITVSRAALQGPGQAGVLRDAINALLDRAAASLGALPAAQREACAAMLAADPYMTSRLLSYLDQKAE